MVSNYIIFIISYFLIVLSVVGHGVLAIKLTKTNISTEEIGFVGLVGIFFLILYSYITQFFIHRDPKRAKEIRFCMKKLSKASLLR